MIGSADPTREPMGPDPTPYSRRVTYRRDCWGNPATKAPQAAAGSTMVFLGTCPGPVHVGVDLHIIGTWINASSKPVNGPVSRSSSGRPMIKRPGDEPSIIVDPTVDDLRLSFRVHDGLRIGAGVPYMGLVP